MRGSLRILLFSLNKLEKVQKLQRQNYATKVRKSKVLQIHHLMFESKFSKDLKQEHVHQRFGAFMQDFSTPLDFYL